MILTTIKKRKLENFGHVLRGQNTTYCKKLCNIMRSGQMQHPVFSKRKDNRQTVTPTIFARESQIKWIFFLQSRTTISSSQLLFFKRHHIFSSALLKSIFLFKMTPKCTWSRSSRDIWCWINDNRKILFPR